MICQFIKSIKLFNAFKVIIFCQFLIPSIFLMQSMSIWFVSSLRSRPLWFCHFINSSNYLMQSMSLWFVFSERSRSLRFVFSDQCRTQQCTTTITVTIITSNTYLRSSIVKTNATIGLVFMNRHSQSDVLANHYTRNGPANVCTLESPNVP